MTSSGNEAKIKIYFFRHGFDYLKDESRDYHVTLCLILTGQFKQFAKITVFLGFVGVSYVHLKVIKM